MQRKAFVLLSGGMDSTTCLYKAIRDFAPKRFSSEDVATYIWAYHHPAEVNPNAILVQFDWVEAVSIDYGQRHQKEIEYAKRTCDGLGIEHTILDVGNLLSGKSVMLSRESVGNVEVPNLDYEDIKGVSPTYVPFRNGLLLSAITAHTQKWVNKMIASAEEEYNYPEPVGVDNFLPESIAKHDASRERALRESKDIAGIYFGAHSEDAANWAYPDCTPEFIGSMANAIYIGSYQTIRLYTPLQWLMKDEIVTLGTKLGVDFASTWSCYKGEEKHCGLCPTCRSRRAAFIRAGVSDPTVYMGERFSEEDLRVTEEDINFIKREMT